MTSLLEFLAKKHQNSSLEYKFPVYDLLFLQKYLILDITKEESRQFISEMLETINFDPSSTITPLNDIFNDAYEKINSEHIDLWYIGLCIKNRNGKLSLIRNGLLREPGLIFKNAVYTVVKYVKGNLQRKRYSYNKTNITVRSIDDFKKYCMMSS